MQENITIGVIMWYYENYGYVFICNADARSFQCMECD